jgi:ankyrin repeat protein
MAQYDRTFTTTHSLTHSLSMASLVSNTQLHTAAQRGDVALLRQALNSNADPDAFQGFSTPLQSAALRGHLEVVRVLVDHKANVNAMSSYTNQTALHEASLMGHHDVVRQLINARAMVNASNSDLETPLHLAMNFHLHAIAAILIDAGADINAKAVCLCCMLRICCCCH